MEYKYKAFISYRHTERDEKVAKVLHNMIETYLIPGRLRKNGQKRLGKVFRDEEELSVSSDLSQNILEALDASEFLIVIASPDTLQSHWCPKEIAYFLEHHSADKLLTVLAGGEADAIFPVLLQGLPEPLYADLSQCRDGRLRSELRERFPKICAPLLGCSYDDLAVREQKRRRRIILTATGAVLSVAMIFIGILLWSNRQIEKKNTVLDQMNTELDKKNRELEQQNQEILLRESEMLTRDAAELLQEKNREEAVRTLLKALPNSSTERPYHAPAEQMLFEVMNFFGKQGAEAIPHSVMLSQSAPVEDYLISADGKSLFTVDPYGSVICFDTATGQKRWSTQLEMERSYNSVAMAGSKRFNSVNIKCNDTIYSISVEDGRTLWTNCYAYYGDRIMVSDDSGYLYCLQARGSSGSLGLTVISLENGTTLDVHEIVNSDTAAYTLFDQGILNSSVPYALSSDGQLFACCFLEKDRERRSIVCCVTDLRTGQTTEVYRKTQETDLESVQRCVFSDQDSTLVLVATVSDSNDIAQVSKIRIADRKLMWQTVCGTDDEDIWMLSEDYACAFNDNYILIGREDVLAALDARTGQLLEYMEMSSEVIRVEGLEDGRFAVILGDGTYTIAWINQNGLHCWNLYMEHPVLNLGAVTDAKLWNEGYLKVDFGAGDIRLYMDSVENGYGYAAVVPESDPQCVMVRRVQYFDPELEEQTFYAAALEEDLIRGRSWDIGADTLVVEFSEGYGEDERHRFRLFDRAALEPAGMVELAADDSRIMLLSDMTGMIYTHDYMELRLYDIVSGESRSLAPLSGEINLELDGETVSTRIRDTGSIRLSADQSVLNVLAGEHGLQILRNGVLLRNLRYPTVQSMEKNHDLLYLGANGFLLIDTQSSYGEPVMDCYLVYDIGADKWCRIPVEEQEKVMHKFCLGDTEPLLAVLDSQGSLRIYDITTGIRTRTWDMGLAGNSVQEIGWILEDRYLAVMTANGYMMILDAASGEVVFRLEKEHYFSSSHLPQFAADAQNRRLYIWEWKGLCLDLDSWTPLTEIPDMVNYDPVTDRCFRLVSEFEEDGESHEYLTAFRIPTTEEMTKLGQQYLGES